MDPPEPARREAFPTWIGPMLATPGSDAFSRAGWLFEPKYDGYRCIAYVQGNEVRLLSRNRKSFDHQFPEILAALQDWDGPDVVLDGELVAIADGRPSFQALQKAGDHVRRSTRRGSSASASQLIYYVFDVLHLAGASTRALPLSARRALLSNLVGLPPSVAVGPAIAEHGVDLFDELCARGWEGIVAKDATSTYESRRSTRWVKVKGVQRQEFVVGGFTEAKGSRPGFGALLVGFFDGGELRFAGKVGTGFSHGLLRSLYTRLHALESTTRPFSTATPHDRESRWVVPSLVVEVGFSEWTGDGRLRHPRFVGVRDDKEATDVTGRP